MTLLRNNKIRFFFVTLNKQEITCFSRNKLNQLLLGFLQKQIRAIKILYSNYCCNSCKKNLKKYLEIIQVIRLNNSRFRHNLFLDWDLEFITRI